MKRFLLAVRSLTINITYLSKSTYPRVYHSILLTINTRFMEERNVGAVRNRGTVLVLHIAIAFKTLEPSRVFTNKKGN